MSGSCVTSTMVMPARPSSWKSAMTSTLVCESRLPVGSSARMQLRLVDERARDRDALLLPARELVGVVLEPLAEADALERRARALRRSRDADAGVDQRQLDVLERARARQQVEALEHEAELAVAHVGELGRGSGPRRRCPSSR